jgi:hypothetical protein
MLILLALDSHNARNDLSRPPGDSIKTSHNLMRTLQYIVGSSTQRKDDQALFVTSSLFKKHLEERTHNLS